MNRLIEIIFCTSDLTMMMFAGFVHYPLMQKHAKTWHKNLIYMLSFFGWISITEGIFAIVNMNKYVLFQNSPVPVRQCSNCLAAFVLFWVGIFITLLVICKYRLLGTEFTQETYTVLLRLNLLRIFVWLARLILLIQADHIVQGPTRHLR